MAILEGAPDLSIREINPRDHGTTLLNAKQTNIRRKKVHGMISETINSTQARMHSTKPKN